MAVIFTHAVGAVSRIRSQRPTVPFQVQFEQGQNRSFIVTQAAIVQQGNYQFLHTLQDMIYVYVFGDRISELQVSGIAFAQVCQQSAGGTITSQISGMNEVLNFYQANRIAIRPTPLKIEFGAGSGAFFGFLTGCQVGVSRPEISLGQWFLRFNAFPP